jgi:hypothetical protein
MLVWMFACSQSNLEYEESEWIDITSFRSALEADIFPEHQPEDIECPPNGFRIETDQLEIQTDICNYAVVEWSTQHAVKAGTTFEALVLHTGLWALEDTSAHFALSIAGELFWEESPPIPSNTEFFFYEARWPTDVPLGTKVHLHLHNHGANDWKLGYFQPIE